VLPELPELCVGEPVSTSSEPAKKNNVKLSSPKIHKFQRKYKKPKLSIDLNRPATKDNQYQDNNQTKVILQKHRSGNSKLQATSEIEEFLVGDYFRSHLLTCFPSKW